MIGLRGGMRMGLAALLAASVGADELGGAAAAGAPTTTLSVAINDTADPVITAVNYDYTVVVSNTGAVDATSVTATIGLDSSLTYVSASGTGWSIDASALPTITATRATLAAGAAAPTITVTVTTGGGALTASTTANANATNASAPAPQDTETTVVGLVSKDATSGRRVPASSTEWTNLINYYGLSCSVPDSLWLCQEASGNLADSIGALTLTATSTPSYQTALSGWTRKGVSAAAGAGSRFSVGVGTGPNPATTSVFYLWLVDITATPAALRGLMTIGGAVAATDFHGAVTTGSKFEIGVVNVTTDGTTDVVTGTAIPMGLQYDRANSVARGITTGELVTGTYSALVTDGTKGIFATVALSSVASTIGYGVMWSGTNAQMTTATIRSLLQALGWTVAW